MLVYKYRVWDIDDNVWDYGWSVTAPTVAPSNPTHAIDSARTTVVEEVDTETLISNYVPNTFTLEEMKKCKCDSIDVRTKQLIADGFEFPPESGQYFSLSIPAQINFTNLDRLRDDPILTYPISVNTRDDDGVFEITDSATMRSFFLSGMGVAKGAPDSGTALKNQVRACTTKAEVEAIVDPR